MGTEGAKPDEKGGIGNGTDEERIKESLEELDRERKPSRDREYLDWLARKFCGFSNKGCRLSEAEKEAFLHGFYACLDGADAAVEKFLNKGKRKWVTMGNKAEEKYGELVRDYPDVSEVERREKDLEEITATGNLEAIDWYSAKVRDAQEGRAIKKKLEDQYGKGKKYGAIGLVPYIGMANMGMDFIHYLRQGGCDDIVNGSRKAAVYVKDGFRKGIGKAARRLKA